MLFHSYEFLLFFAVVSAAYFALPFRLRWAWLLAASYVFYGAWRVEYLALIIASTAVDYGVGRALGVATRPRARRALLAASLSVNLGLLFAFKYFNFAAESGAALVRFFGLDYLAPHLGVLLPVGISFYAFQTLSYTIDVYRGDLAPERHAGRFALFVAFFPQLVAGPIERAGRLLPQLNTRHEFDYERVRGGLLLVLFGFFKKVVIADRLAVAVNFIYAQPERCPGPVLLLGTVFFAFQIYCDFSGYTDIARGCARILGIDLMKNFDRPYFATSIANFWRRWHLSLTTWFRDYVYVPLGGNRRGRRRWVANVIIVFLVSGVWHGASWTFVAWGLVHAIAYWTERGIGAVVSQRVPRVIRIAITFSVVAVAWIFFRAATLPDALYILQHLASGWGALTDVNVLTELVASMDLSWASLGLTSALVGLLIVIEWWLGDEPWEKRVAKLSTWKRWLVYSLMGWALFNLGTTNEVPFVYYQF